MTSAPHRCAPERIRPSRQCNRSAAPRIAATGSVGCARRGALRSSAKTVGSVPSIVVVVAGGGAEVAEDASWMTLMRSWPASSWPAYSLIEVMGPCMSLLTDGLGRRGRQRRRVEEADMPAQVARSTSAGADRFDGFRAAQLRSGASAGGLAPRIERRLVQIGDERFGIGDGFFALAEISINTSVCSACRSCTKTFGSLVSGDIDVAAAGRGRRLREGRPSGWSTAAPSIADVMIGVGVRTAVATMSAGLEDLSERLPSGAASPGDFRGGRLLLPARAYDSKQSRRCGYWAAKCCASRNARSSPAPTTTTAAA